MSGPRPVTLAICAYNASRTIARTLDSALAQTYRPLEIIVIDDASRDDTVAIVKRVAAEHPTIRLIVQPRNEGIAQARQTALLAAQTDWLAFLDADDIAAPEMLARQVEMLEADPDLIGVSTYARYIGDDEQRTIALQQVGYPSKQSFMARREAGKLIYLLPNTLFSRASALRVGGYRLAPFPTGPVRYRDFSEDVDLWCRMSDLAGEGRYFVTIPEPLLAYRKSPGSLSTASVAPMQQKMRWIKDCLTRRRAGEAERSFADFIAARGLLTRLDNGRSDLAAGHYKRAGLAFIARRYLTFAGHLLAVAVLDLPLLVRKLAIQKRARAG